MKDEDAVICDAHRWKFLSTTQPMTSRWPWRLSLKGTGLESRLWKGETRIHIHTHYMNSTRATRPPSHPNIQNAFRFPTFKSSPETLRGQCSDAASSVTSRGRTHPVWSKVEVHRCCYTAVKPLQVCSGKKQSKVLPHVVHTNLFALPRSCSSCWFTWNCKCISCTDVSRKLARKRCSECGVKPRPKPLAFQTQLTSESEAGT